jgi:hypothetical protein
MFLRATIRKKDGKLHRYFSVVENKRVRGGRVVQRHVLYLREINSSQELARRKSIEVLDAGGDGPRTLTLFPEDHCEATLPDESVVRLRLSHLRLEQPRQWGGLPLCMLPGVTRSPTAICSHLSPTAGYESSSASLAPRRWLVKK